MTTALTHLDLGSCRIGTGLPLAFALKASGLRSLHLRISCNALSGCGSLAQLAGLLQLRALSLVIHADLAEQGAAHAFTSAKRSRVCQ